MALTGSELEFFSLHTLEERFDGCWPRLPLRLGSGRARCVKPMFRRALVEPWLRCTVSEFIELYSGSCSADDSLFADARDFLDTECSCDPWPLPRYLRGGSMLLMLVLPDSRRTLHTLDLLRKCRGEFTGPVASKPGAWASGLNLRYSSMICSLLHSLLLIFAIFPLFLLLSVLPLRKMLSVKVEVSGRWSGSLLNFKLKL